MDKIQKGDALTQSKDLITENIEKLKQLFPEVVAEGKIDFTALQSVFGEEIEENEEYYRFTWAGKSKARMEAHKPSTGTLRPAKDESVNWDSTQNLYIEGDNLEVLKLLQKSYAGKIKMIYIDPPYNTGSDFVYKDDYKDNLKNYHRLSGLLDEEGNKISTNSDNDGRYHSNWLNMIYPRLRLARNLLKDEGVIFISIDDKEVDNLRKVCDEIFGGNNFITTFIWEKRTNRENRKVVSTRHDYILCYTKQKVNDRKALKQLPMNEKALANYKNPDNDERGLWKSDPATAQAGHGTKSQFYDFKAPNGKVHKLESGRCWLYTEQVMYVAIKENRIWFGKEGNGVPRVKTYLHAKERGLTPETILFAKDVTTTEIAKNKLKDLFNGIAVFETPKPTELLKQLLLLTTENDDLVLDFFAGSSTTSNAVLELNEYDKGNRKFIEVQLPELTSKKSEAYKAGYKRITEIGKERIRIVISKILERNKDVIKQKEILLSELKNKVELFENNERINVVEKEIDNLKSFQKSFDGGFKILKLDSSNIKNWDGSAEDLQQSLYDAVSNIKEERTEEDVLYEILLKYGLDLTLPIEEREIAGKRVFNIGMGAMFICLANSITSAVAEGIGEWKEELQPEICRVIFKDTGFTDVEKTNSVQTLKRFGIQEVKSI